MRIGGLKFSVVQDQNIAQHEDPDFPTIQSRDLVSNYYAFQTITHYIFYEATEAPEGIRLVLIHCHVQGRSQDFSKGGSHCVRVRILSWHFRHLL